MKTLPRTLLPLVLLCSSAAISTAAHATVTWTSTFESGDYHPEWKDGINDTKVVGGTTRKNVEVLGEKVFEGKNACKVTLHPDDTFTYGQNRVDIQHPSTLTGEGMDMYLSGHYFLPEDAKTRNEFGFFETTPSFTNWVDIWVEPKTGGGTTIKLGIESQGANLGSVLIWMGDFTPAVWHQIALHVHWSTDATKGLVDFWLDGKQVVTAYKHKTKPNGDALFYQTGLHRLSVANFTETIYFDDFIEATTPDEIKIAAPNSNGGSTDGGTNDASGAGGASSAAGSDGAAGATTGVAGSTGAAGTTGASGSTGAAGTGTAGTGSTGAGGTTSASGSAGAGGTTGTAGSHASHSGGCATAGESTETGAFALAGLALAAFGTALTSRRRRS